MIGKNKLSYFIVDGELLFHLMTHYQDFDCSLPEDTKLEWIEMEPVQLNGPIVNGQGRIRFVIGSDSFGELPEGSCIPRVSPSWHRPGHEQPE